MSVGSGITVEGRTGVSETSMIGCCCDPLPELGAGCAGSGTALVAPVMVSMILSESVVEAPDPAALDCAGVFVIGNGAAGSGGVVKVTTLSLVP